MTTNPICALLVEDNPGDARLVREALVDVGGTHIELVRVETLADALDRLARQRFDLVLLDLTLPDSHGLGTVQKITHSGTKAPIVILTGLDDEALAIEAVRAGAQDYLVKSEITGHLLTRVAHHAIERQHLSDTLHDNEARLRALFDNMKSGVVVYRVKGDGESFIIHDFNRGAEKIEGVRREDLIGRDVTEAFPAVESFGLLEVFRRVWRTGIAEPFPVRWYQDARIAGWRDNHVYKLPSGEIVAIYDDVTEAKRTENQLRLAAKVFEGSTEGIVITDARNRILSINHAFTDITGYLPEDVLGQDPSLLKSGKHGNTFYQNMWATLRETGHWDGEVWNRRKNGEIYPEWLSISSVKDDHGQAISHYIAIFSDITHRKAAEERIYYLAHHDALTGLPNRMLLQDRIAQTIATAQYQGGRAALLLIDLDRFKTINESLDHAFGDRLLQLMAHRLGACARPLDTVARTGGDEFVILLADAQGAQEIATFAQKVLAAATQPFQLDEHELNITVSIGISTYPDDGDTPQSLLKNADVAMYRAKESGRNNYQFYTQDMNTRTFQALALENRLRHALKNQEFLLHYQPQIDLRSRTIIGAEALLRLQHPELGLVPPASFIPIAEETGLIVPIGEWVLREACIQAKTWHDAGYPQLRIAVNLSARQFRQRDLLDAVDRALRDSRLPAHALELELTESILMQDTQENLATLLDLKKMGVQLSIDDFGTGFSSLGYLKRFNLDKLKIDQSFVRDITHDPNDLAIAQAVIALGHSLNLRVIAEGVETAEQLALLRENGCDEMQGYYFSRPLPADAFFQLLRDKQQGEN